MHFGYNNDEEKNSLGIEMLNNSHCEKVLGVLFYDKLTFKDYVCMCVKKASQVHNMTLANVHNMTLANVHNFQNKILLNVYEIHARPYLV